MSEPKNNATLTYEVDLLMQRSLMMEQAVNEIRAKVGLPGVQLPKPIRGVRVHQPGE